MRRSTARVLPFAIGLAVVLLSPALLDFEPRRMTNDEAHYAWKAGLLAGDLGLIDDERSWRRHPPTVAALTAVIARGSSLDAALSAVPKLSLWLAASAMAAAVLALGGGPAGAALGATLLVLGGTVRGYASHYLLDVPLLACLLGAVALWARGGAARVGAFALAALAALVKSYGVLVPVVLVAAAIYERLGGRLRIALWVGLAAALTGFHLLRGAGIIELDLFWLRDFDFAERTRFKLYELAQAFGWLLPGARARWVVVLIVPLFAASVWILRSAPRPHRALLAMLVGVPGAPLLVSNVTDPRMLLMVTIPLQLVLAVAAGRALAVLTPRRQRVAGIAAALGCAALLVVADRTHEASEPCRNAGQWEVAARLLEEPDGRTTRVYAAGIHQTRFYTGLELEIDGGTIYGPDERHWVGNPREFFESDEALDAAYLALVWNRETNYWVQFEPALAARLQRAGFRGVDAVYLPAHPACAPADEAERRAEDAFFAAFGFARTRTGAEGGAEQAMGILLHRPKPAAPPPEYTGYVHPNRPW